LAGFSEEDLGKFYDEFSTDGFLSSGISSISSLIRQENQELFQLSEDTARALIRVGHVATEKSAGVLNWSQRSIATRILLRSVGMLQGTIVISERGMVPEARTLARGLFECGFCVAAVIAESEKFIKLLKEDSQSSRRRQGAFILESKMGEGTFDAEKLKKIIEGIEKKNKMLDLKAIAGFSSMKILYSEYQRLSDDSAHLSARSLHRHLTTEGKKIVGYQIGPGSPSEVAATLHRAIMASLPIGIGITSLFEDVTNNLAFQELGERFERLPAGEPI
jgi:hypothetical protein